jgi:hypothetical protein
MGALRRRCPHPQLVPCPRSTPTCSAGLLAGDEQHKEVLGEGDGETTPLLAPPGQAPWELTRGFKRQTQSRSLFVRSVALTARSRQFFFARSRLLASLIWASFMRTSSSAPR